MKANGARFLFLPPYSPDLNPIEMAISRLKTLLCRDTARTCNDPWKAVGHVRGHFTAEECCNFFAAAGSKSN